MMIELVDKGVYCINGNDVIAADHEEMLAEHGIDAKTISEAKKGTIAYPILESHSVSKDEKRLRVRFDAMASHDITYVGIIQTARASGMTKFDLPYVLTCCHNSLCAVGGTINDDDHLFGLSAAKKYGGIYVPPHMAVIHQFMRENFAGCGKMILGSDSHTRYGALGTIAIGEGGGELDKQLLGDTYDIDFPDVIAVFMEGAPKPGVGPMDVALAIIRAVYGNGFVKNKIMEFIGPGIASLPVDFRLGIDVMTTETTCLSSIWQTDEKTKSWLATHGRVDDYEELKPERLAYYDGMVKVDLSKIEPMVALPFHPSNAYAISELYADLEDILHETELKAQEVSGGNASFHLMDKIAEDGRLQCQQGVIAGCAGGAYSNIVEAAHCLKGASIGDGEYYLSVYPSSQPVFIALDKLGLMADLMDSGAIVRTAFCGPCFGAGDTPANDALSIRHTTRNFPNREGSKPQNGQMSAVALMDARSIAATSFNQGKLTSATEFDVWGDIPEYEYDDRSYKSRVYWGWKEPDDAHELRFGPNIKDWPELEPLADDILLRLASKIEDDVTTTDELIPSGETSSYRSNPLGLAEFTLSRRDPGYVDRAKAVQELENARLSNASSEILHEVCDRIRKIPGFDDADMGRIEIGSAIYAKKPGDGSAREQAASCQRVLGGLANIVEEYATKRYRSNCINWGMIPFQFDGDTSVFDVGDWVFVPDIRKALACDIDKIRAYVISDENIEQIDLHIAPLTTEETEILKAGCLINFNKQKLEKGNR